MSMRYIRGLVVRVVPILAVCLAVNGCERYERAEIRVIDGESGKPVEGARVETSYAYYMDFTPPKSDEGVTDKEGKAALELSVRDGRLGITARHPDFIEFHPASTVRLYQGWIPESPAIVIPLFRLPRPTVCLVVPDGYNGIIRFEPSFSVELTRERLDQVLELIVPADGIVSQTVPQALQGRVDFLLRFASDRERETATVIENGIGPTYSQASFWHLDWDRVFIVGSYSDANRVFDFLYRPTGNGSGREHQHRWIKQLTNEAVGLPGARSAP